MGESEFDPPDPKVIFGTLVAQVRSEIKAVLHAETADGKLRFSDDGFDLDEGRSWKASVWRPSDAANLLELECRQGKGDRWQILIAPTSANQPAFVLHWPSRNFEIMLRTAVRMLRT